MPRSLRIVETSLCLLATAVLAEIAYSSRLECVLQDGFGILNAFGDTARGQEYWYHPAYFTMDPSRQTVNGAGVGCHEHNLFFPVRSAIQRSIEPDEFADELVDGLLATESELGRAAIDWS